MNNIVNIIKSSLFTTFLRYQKIFVKGKYSRSRQWSKNIIYFGVYMNITLFFLGTYYCYHFTLNLLYFIYVFILAFVSYALVFKLPTINFNLLRFF